MPLPIVLKTVNLLFFLCYNPIGHGRSSVGANIKCRVEKPAFMHRTKAGITNMFG